MGLFSRLFAPSESPSAKLVAELRELREEVQTMRLEWDAIQQRLSKWISRENARKRAALAQTLAEPGEDTGSGEIGPQNGSQEPSERKAMLRRKLATLHR